VATVAGLNEIGSRAAAELKVENFVWLRCALKRGEAFLFIDYT